MHLSFTCFLLSLYQSPLSTKLWHLVKASFIGVLSFNHFPQVRQNGPYIQCARRCPEVPLGKLLVSYSFFLTYSTSYLSKTLEICCWTETDTILPSWNWQYGPQNTLTHQKGTGEVLHFPWPVFLVPVNATFDQSLGRDGGSRTNTKVQQSRRGLGPEPKSHIQSFRL